MKRFLTTTLTLFVSAIVYGQSYAKSDIDIYIQNYAGVAIEKMREHNIPASITLAQGILESAAGTSELAKNANNHFGIKCGGQWSGKIYIKDDDKANECFRKYDSPELSYEDHTVFLQAARYAELFTLDITDYKSWAHGLKSAGYATHPQYAERLIRVIEDYNLTRFDYMVTQVNYYSTQTAENQPVESSVIYLPQGEKNLPIDAKTSKKLSKKQASRMPPMDNRVEVVGNYRGFPQVKYPYTNRPVFINNGVHFVVAQGGDTYFSIAMDVQLTIAELKCYNEVFGQKYEPYYGEIVYLEKKKRYANVSSHTVKAGETVHSIAQYYACKSKTICRLNNLKKQHKLNVREVVRLR